MPKNKKIKRYKKIYTAGESFRRHLIRGLGAVAGLCVLGFIGWSAYGPVMDYLHGISITKDTPSSLASQQNEEPPTGDQDPSPTPPDQDTASTAPIKSGQVKGIVVAHEQLLNQSALETLLDQYAAEGINTVMVDLKNSTGMVLYHSSLPAVTALDAQNESAYDLDALCKAASKRKIRVIGRMPVYKDAVAASRLEGSAVKYAGSDYLWLDNAREAGGKPWLNPYSEIAQSYITDLAMEAVSMGVSEIVVDSVQFPSGFSQEYCAYGETNGKSKSQVLSEYIDTLSKQLEGKGAQLTVSLDARTALGDYNTYYGNANPLSILGNRFIIDFSPTQFGGSYESEQLTLTNPSQNPKESVDKMIKALSTELKNKEITALLQGDESSTKEQTTVLAANKITSYINY